MGYALFAQRKLTLTGQLNIASLQQTMAANQQFALATHTTSLQQQLSSLQTSQANELADYYKQLADVGAEQEVDGQGDATVSKSGSDVEDTEDVDSKTLQDQRDAIANKIKEIELRNEGEIDAINRQIYLTSIKENSLEMWVKRLDTQVTALQKELESVMDAESSGIDRATPKFKGVG